MRRLLCLLAMSCAAAAAPPELVIYNNEFGVVRDTLELQLQPGENVVRYDKLTEQIDVGSVVLRDPAGKTQLQIVEQKFNAQGLKQEDLVEHYEGQTLTFRVIDGSTVRELDAKIVRAGIAEPHGGRGSPIVEINGRYMWELPGTPLFPRLPEGAVLKPELTWRIASDLARTLTAELVFATAGLDWTADYNAVTTERGDIAQLVGWITIHNRTARAFEDAKVKVVAGDINKVDPRSDSGAATTERVIVTGSYIPTGEAQGSPPPVERKNFGEYHEYALQRPVTLRAGDTTQVEFLRVADVPAKRSFVYTGALAGADDVASGDEPILDPQFGTRSNKKVVILTEFANDAAHRLGFPLPEGRIRFYQDVAQKLQFSGESQVDNTAQNETVRAVSGNAFDLVGERRQVDFRVNEEARTAEESFEIKLRNHRDQPVEIRVLERTARWRQWEITAQSDEFKKIDARTIEFRVAVEPNKEKVITYAIRYTQLPRARR